ncbi:efflux RND transporter periplasmic adaptor subunit [Gallaecimonas xiamenensis]|uniref:Multidrug ABC transporter n=1 Tax=Gallaecimonas xiamenensis 3-C-1 TaxID=745411 RepID=K2JRA7_9GAMM|nr:efflux RND transporter periplasmic adaptor subunit [Gallaecimonas xiamenensis]EKE77918.1 multidrug ABC transporter [Gallaecimonas xiamenensis 3-C-1]
MKKWLLCTLLTLGACSKEVPPQADQDIARPVKLHYIDNLDEGQVRHFPGNVKATNGSVLAFRLSGQLEARPVKPGQQVEQGTLLAKLDDTDYQNQLLDRQAQFELADAQFNRAQQMLDKALIPRATFDEAKAKRTQAQAALRLARDNLKYTELRAPYSGVVARTYVENYQFVQAKEPIVDLQNDKLIDIEVQIPERFISRVDPTAKDYHPRLTFSVAPDQVYEATYKEHDAAADPATRAFKVTLTMERPSDLNVLPGMSVDVAVDMNKVFRLNTQPQVVIPAEAVFRPDDKAQAMVWRYDSDSQRVSRVAVTLGQMVSDGIVVTQGLAPGDTVVVAGVHHLHEGQKVRPLVKERGL